MTDRAPIPVWWLSLNPGTPCRGYWDQQILEDILAGRVWDHGFEFVHHVGVDDRPAGGAVVVIPARSQVPHVEQLNAVLAPLPWVMLMVLGDEEHVFPWMAVKHPRMRVWVQSPDPYQDTAADGYLPVGWTPGTYETSLLPTSLHPDEGRHFDWFFSGQVTHDRRRQAAHALARLMTDRTYLNQTPSFTAGLPRDQYLEGLHDSVIAPCPSGPVTVDTFRLWEALELGCVPIVDTWTPKRNEAHYWTLMFSEPAPFPLVENWLDVGALIKRVLADPVGWQVKVGAWWGRQKADLVDRFARQLRDLAGVADEPDDLITVLVVASPIPSHPRGDVLAETIDSIRGHLPRARIVVACDGVRAEQEHLRPAYRAFLHDAVTQAGYRNVVFSVNDSWRHQAMTARLALPYVSTPCVLFVEHDTPLTDDPIPWADLVRQVFIGAANVIRFHHEAEIHPEHRWLMVDLERRFLGPVPVMQTMQWSQRPHLADTGFYRRVLFGYFGEGGRTMIEDTMHGVLDHDWREHGREGADRWRTFLYAPEGSMRRSTHTDGRETEPKFDMIYEYDGAPPEGAPYPTSLRSD